MNLTTDDSRRRFANSPVARLATADKSGVPHIVPVTFAVDDNVIYFAIDHKPKRSTNLRRLRNIAENPAVTLIVDHYAEEWSELWWARADGHAEVWENGDTRMNGIERLQGKYRQYVETPPEGPVVVIRVDTWTGWAFTG
jgi:PPOX class probable F420-dependent enzyme